MAWRRREYRWFYPRNLVLRTANFVFGSEISMYGHTTQRAGMAILTYESRPIEGFIPADTLVQTGTTGDNGTVGKPASTMVSGRMKPSLGGISSVNTTVVWPYNRSLLQPTLSPQFVTPPLSVRSHQHQPSNVGYEYTHG